ncbi:hypothetical protein FBEOM_3915 [Fusarium beomiforme]|uniref:Uncharacterized protein n=1 Tax=Fusarium beomiforme TaxID=44412 RepID=A0A9P5AP56_9HYPO|nr:hypothetical protein FBEOM_3915 [Fusarium beomiforme]
MTRVSFSKDGPSAENGLAGYKLNFSEVAGRENQVEALEDFEVEEDRCSDHLEDDDYVDITDLNKTTKVTLDNKRRNVLIEGLADNYFLDIEEDEKEACAKTQEDVKGWMSRMAHGTKTKKENAAPQFFEQTTTVAATSKAPTGNDAPQSKNKHQVRKTDNPTSPEIPTLDDVSRRMAMKYAVMAGKKSSSDDQKPDNMKAAEDAMASATHFLKGNQRKDGKM